MEKIDNHQFYLESHEKFGISAKGVRWNTKENQYVRFENLISCIKDLENSSLLDIGCGYGDLIKYFQKEHIYPKSYIGIDCENFMIKSAMKRFPQSKFLIKNFLKHELPKADYYVCSGAFNTLQNYEIQKAIRVCFEQSRKGLVFNFLTKAFVHNLNTFDIYTYCKSLTNDIDFKGGYLENDFTFFLKK